MAFWQACFFHLFLTLLLPFTDMAHNITGDKGMEVHFPCNINYSSSGEYAVNLMKNGISRVCFYRISNNKLIVSNCNVRWKFSGQPPELYLMGLKFSDSGIYYCVAEQVIPPPTMVIRNYTLHLTVKGVEIEVHNRSEQGCIELRCQQEGLSQHEFTWTRQKPGTERTKIQKLNTSQPPYILRLCKPNWSEGDTISCQVGNYSDNFNTATATGAETQQTNTNIILISVISSVLLLILCVVGIICCWRRANAAQTCTTSVYTNKIYGNLTFGTVAQPNPTSDRPECIYEN